MSKRSTILKIAGLDPKEKRTHICVAAITCAEAENCRHGHLHKPDEEECLQPDYCSDYCSHGDEFGREAIVRCVEASHGQG